MLCGIVFHFSNHRVALRQQLVEVFVDVVLSERAAQIFGANHSFSPGFIMRLTCRLRRTAL